MAAVRLLASASMTSVCVGASSMPPGPLLPGESVSRRPLLLPYHHSHPRVAQCLQPNFKPVLFSCSYAIACAAATAKVGLIPASQGQDEEGHGTTSDSMSGAACSACPRCLPLSRPHCDALTCFH